MVNKSTSQDDKTWNAITEIAQTLEEVLQKVSDANMKLDHLIETYCIDRHAYRQSGLHDPFNGYYTE